MTKVLFALLLGLAPWHGDVEPPAARTARLRIVAQAIDTAAAGDRTIALLLVVQGEGESHYARHVHEGRCGEHPLSPPGECDRGRSVSPWQVLLGPWLPRERWEDMRGADIEATTRAATYAARPLRHGLYVCRGRGPSPLHGAISVAARGGCGWPGADRRVARYHALERRWGRLVAAP
jgi:hypothetical protein